MPALPAQKHFELTSFGVKPEARPLNPLRQAKSHPKSKRNNKSRIKTKIRKAASW
jgi:hypothetical protein